MNKKIIITGLLFLILFSFVVALEEPTAGIGGEDVEQLQGAIDDYVPINETGEVDFNRYQPFKTKAEERIDAINLWLEENALWLKVIFGMVPSISFLFAINFYILLFFIVTIILNADGTFGIFDSLSKKIDLAFFEVSLANLFGLAIFIILLTTKVFVKLTYFVYGLWNIAWNYVLPWGFAIAITLMVVGGIIFGFLLTFLPQVLRGIAKKFEEQRGEKDSKKEETNREALGKIVEGVVEA